MKFIIKNLILIILFSLILDFFKNDNSYFKILASNNSRVDINIGESFGIDLNIKNLKDRKKMYEKEIIEKVMKGRSNDVYKLGKYIIGENFYEEEYCKEVGEYSIIGNVPYPTWCNRESGPFSIIQNPKSALILPLTIELKTGFKKNIIDTLLEGLEADYIGVIKGHDHDPLKLTGPNFKLGQDQLLGIVNRTKNLMQLYEISNLGISRKKSYNDSFKNSSYDIVINLINKKDQVYGGVSFGNNKKHCRNHSKNCFLKSIHLLEYHHKINAPELVYKKEWGYITEKLSPPYSLIKNYGGFQKIFLSRNYYILIDLNADQVKNISSIEVRDIINE